MITEKKIESGIRGGLITLEVDPNMQCGTVCQIGDGWFYFGGTEAEGMRPSEYLSYVPIEDIVREIYDTLQDFDGDEELQDEYDYYDAILECLN